MPKLELRDDYQRHQSPFKMMYHITNLCPRTDISIGRCGFSIQLYPSWKAAVLASKLTQANINTAIEQFHRAWLDGCGYNQIFDPDKSALDEWREMNLGIKAKPGTNSRPLYGSHAIRVSWGPWGPEHITVPGNACGLDIEVDNLYSPRHGAILCPHNIDCFSQVILLLTVFTTIADFLIDHSQAAEPTLLANSHFLPAMKPLDPPATLPL